MFVLGKNACIFDMCCCACVQIIISTIDLLTGKGGAIRADYRKSLNSGSGYVPHPNW
jgi:hypothetical protein